MTDPNFLMAPLLLPEGLLLAHLGRWLMGCQDSRFALAKDVMVEIVSSCHLFLFGAQSKQGKARTNRKFAADVVTNDNR